MTAVQLHAADVSKGDKAALVSIGSHSLFLRVSGPHRKPGDSVVIIEDGHADSSLTWFAAQRYISSFARVCSYDSAGYGHSEASSTPRTAENIAHELLALLRAAKIEPPYVLVGHSYGWILVREFLALLTPEQMVAGMVLVDTNQEKTHVERPFPMAQLIAVLGHLDSYKVMGLEDSFKLTSNEWKAAKALETAKSHGVTGEREREHMESSANLLAEKRQIEKQILRSGVHAGNGASEDQNVLEDLLNGLDDIENKLQIEQLG